MINQANERREFAMEFLTLYQQQQANVKNFGYARKVFSKFDNTFFIFSYLARSISFIHRTPFTSTCTMTCPGVIMVDQWLADWMFANYNAIVITHFRSMTAWQSRLAKKKRWSVYIVNPFDLAATTEKNHHIKLTSLTNVRLVGQHYLSHTQNPNFIVLLS